MDRFRPRLESLEPRLVPAVVVWGGGNGDWETGANWLGGVKPAATDRVVINGGACRVAIVNEACQQLTITAGLLDMHNSRGVVVGGQGGPEWASSVGPVGNVHFDSGTWLDLRGSFSWGGDVGDALSTGSVYVSHGGSMSLVANSTNFFRPALWVGEDNTQAASPGFVYVAANGGSTNDVTVMRPWFVKGQGTLSFTGVDPGTTAGVADGVGDGTVRLVNYGTVWREAPGVGGPWDVSGLQHIGLIVDNEAGGFFGVQGGVNFNKAGATSFNNEGGTFDVQTGNEITFANPYFQTSGLTVIEGIAGQSTVLTVNGTMNVLGGQFWVGSQVNDFSVLEVTSLDVSSNTDFYLFAGAAGCSQVDAANTLDIGGNVTVHLYTDIPPAPNTTYWILRAAGTFSDLATWSWEGPDGFQWSRSTVGQTESISA